MRAKRDRTGVSTLRSCAVFSNPYLCTGSRRTWHPDLAEPPRMAYGTLPVRIFRDFVIYSAAADDGTTKKPDQRARLDMARLCG